MERNTFIPQTGEVSEQLVSTERRVISQVYTWMGLGLALTAAVAYYTAGSEEILGFLFSNRFVFYGLMIAELALVIGISWAINRIPAAVATALFFVYAALNGLTLSAIFLIYSGASIAGTF
ncbi:MAG: Bax inhibitor-1 family protein, partial [Rhizobacter sp.]|nr:Bax inhibitor-1 family protein [Chlorobiales bacterium]